MKALMTLVWPDIPTATATLTALPARLQLCSIRVKERPVLHALLSHDGLFSLFHHAFPIQHGDDALVAFGRVLSAHVTRHTQPKPGPWVGQEAARMLLLETRSAELNWPGVDGFAVMTTVTRRVEQWVITSGTEAVVTCAQRDPILPWAGIYFSEQCPGRSLLIALGRMLLTRAPALHRSAQVERQSGELHDGT